ncbi:MAG: peptidoglycan-associated lipoprotein Pal [Thermodesulfovibrionales bacterium]|nr:peptidoglycan-associated lipoprotein Pal [Thermodesulfovibrionales bacterium]
MKRIFLLFLAFILVFIFAGCAKRAVTMPVTQEVSKETAQKAAPVEPGKKAEPAPMKKEEPVVMAKAEPKKAETMPAKEVTEAKSSQFGNILFDFDQYTIREDAKPTLKSAADWLIKNRDAKMILEGHCDDKGTNEYNLALGEKRAKSAMDYIISAGVTKNRLDTISYGEEKPLCKEQTEDCWQKNRRVQFVSGKAGK